MKMRLLLFAAVSVLISAASTAGAAPPPTLPDGPDLSLMALAASDFSSGRVSSEQYAQTDGQLAIYVREFSRLGGRLDFAINDVTLHETGATADEVVALLRLVFQDQRGRAAFAKGFRQAIAAEVGRRVTISKLVVSRPLALGAGEQAFRISVSMVTNVGRFHMAMSFVRVERVVGTIILVAKRGRTVPLGDVARTAEAQARRFRSGLTIASVAAPVISGQAGQGQTLNADRGRWTGGPSQYSHQWSRCDAAGGNCVAIPGATGGSYTLTAADAGSTIRVRVDARNGISNIAVDSLSTGVVV
jgi:hypothetical protein